MSDDIREPVYGANAAALRDGLRRPETALRAFLTHSLTCSRCAPPLLLCEAADGLFSALQPTDRAQYLSL